MTKINNASSGKKWSDYSGNKWIVFIQGRNEWCLFREEMNSAYSGKKWSVYSGKKWIVFIQGRNE